MLANHSIINYEWIPNLGKLIKETFPQWKETKQIKLRSEKDELLHAVVLMGVQLVDIFCTFSPWYKMIFS